MASANGMAEAMKYEADLQRQLALASASYGQTASAVGMGSKEAERAQARLSLEQDTNNKVLALRTELATATTDKQRQTLETQIALTEQYGARQVQVMQDGWQKVDQAQGDWSKGASAAWQNYRDDVANIAGQTQSLISDAFDGAEDVLTEFVKTGKLSFKSLADSIVDDLIRIQVRKALVGAVSSFASSGLGSGIASVFQADGGVWDRGVQKFAKGAAFTNSIVNTPTLFGMAGGKTGMAGEAGPEAIMPLTRAADGSLGVRMVGGDAVGGSTALTSTALGSVTQHFTFQGNADSVSRAEVRRAAQEGAQAAYQMVLNDFKTNGPARQLINR
ncbi:Prophage PssSM-03, putative tail length tape measure protein [Pseudomonas savastanoi]|uniref:Prophage PssSM-03, putative tail length tape measure protein n=3 Tax=Pseudomonas syringae group TaxID=136849 RepID=A0A0N8R369_PSESX|nr:MULTISPECIES: phage tail tape measure protein [Pseudomonas syringae group]KPW88758.1 Prophage PssSM-03, putative tail length tape measure protein [Pseudomonas syringae pv. castaneae]RMS87319.1 Prophage PssSM-03, putative tail length tape measure protein [Pseudomonas savastanoi]